eukprot:GFUD01034821.1.p1 GENE.GFUD01034821.1~~GFUD01034821.1.p1  ORF type:complete len:483 (+),score=128.47 GFUD01034821.1:72-1520(+)
MDNLYSSIMVQTKDSGQQHLLRFWNELDVTEQVKLAAQINSLDLKEVNSMFSHANVKKNSDSAVEPVRDSMVGTSNCPKEELETWRQVGLETLGRNEVGVILLAGGQGTRLGSEKPKALFDVGLPSKKSLIELQAEKIRKLEELSSGKISWYVMASPATVDQIQEAFENNENFGLDRDQVKIFCQGTIPCLSDEGDVLLKGRGIIATNPDGNGGLYKALKKEGILDDMRSRGIKHIFVYCVDNILVKVADPEFLGFCISRKADCGNKVVRRVEGESVGVTCLLDGKPGVVEYTEMSEEIREKKTPNDDLVFGAANICIHYFSLDFLSQAVEREADMPVHIARKKIPHIAECGNFITPEVPSGVKLEKFIFDVFQFADPEKFVVYESKRDEEFEPLKNSTGTEGTPASCRAAVAALHAGWLLRAGAELVGPDGEQVGVEDKMRKEVVVEVSPKVSYAGEGLEKIVGGKMLSWPLHLTKNKNYF